MEIKPKEKLRTIRKSKFSQVEFAELVSMDQSQYSRRELGKVFISNEEWERFAKVLQVPVEDIKEDDLAGSVNIIHNHGENDNSINGYEIKINVPKNIFDLFHTKLDTLITLISNK